MSTSRSKPVSRQQGGGFTMIELLVLIAVVGLLFAIAIPAFQSFRMSSLLRQAQQETAAIIARGRWLAINSGQPRTIDLTSGTTVLVREGGTTVASMQLGEFQATQTHTSGADTFVFDNRGIITSGTAPVVITLTSPNGGVRTVTVDLLGKITNS